MSAINTALPVLASRTPACVTTVAEIIAQSREKAAADEKLSCHRRDAELGASRRTVSTQRARFAWSALS